MNSWRIAVPHKHRDEALIDVAGHCRELGPDEARVMRQIVFSAQVDSGLRSAGELLDHLDSLEPAERRKLLNKARAEVGLEHTDTVDARQRVHTINRVDLGPGYRSATPPTAPPCR